MALSFEDKFFILKVEYLKDLVKFRQKMLNASKVEFDIDYNGEKRKLSAVAACTPTLVL